MTKITKGVIVAVCAAIACAVIVGAIVVFTAPLVAERVGEEIKKESVAQYAGDSVPAPFGLQWGMKCEEILALGVKNQDDIPCFNVYNFPKGIEGFYAFLTFNTSGELIAVRASRDPLPSYSVIRINDIKDDLTAKYGKGVGWNEGMHLSWMWQFADGSIMVLDGGSHHGLSHDAINLHYITAAARAVAKERREILEEKRESISLAPEEGTTKQSIERCERSVWQNLCEDIVKGYNRDLNSPTMTSLDVSKEVKRYRIFCTGFVRGGGAAARILLELKNSGYSKEDAISASRKQVETCSIASFEASGERVVTPLGACDKARWPDTCKYAIKTYNSAIKSIEARHHIKHEEASVRRLIYCVGFIAGGERVIASFKVEKATGDSKNLNEHVSKKLGPACFHALQ